MRPTPTLEELINALSPAEKRYLNLFARKRLPADQEKSAGLLESLVKPKQKAITLSASDRNYLYNFILKAMRSYHEGTSVDIRLKELLISSGFLFDKRLYEQSLRLLQKAKELAGRFDRYHVQLEILFLETRIVIEHNAKNPLEVIEALHADTDKIMHMLFEDQALVHLQQRIFIFQRQHYHLEEDKHNIQREELHQRIASAKASGRFDPQYYGLFALAIYHHCQADYDSCAAAYEDLVALWEAWPDRIREESIRYKKTLSNYLAICHRLARFNRFPGLLERIRSIPCRTAEEEAEQFQNLQFMELLYLMNTDGYDQLDQFAATTREGLDRYQTKVNKARGLAFYYNLAVAYFLKHDWKAALEWLTPIIRQEKNLHRQDIQNFSRLFRLVLWYESGKHDLLEYELINAERFLRSRKAWHAFPSALVRLLKKLIESDRTEHAQLFEKFLAQIEAPGNKLEVSLIGREELSYWAKSHLSGVTMRKLLQESAAAEREAV